MHKSSITKSLRLIAALLIAGAGVADAQTKIDVSKQVQVAAAAYEPLGVNNFGKVGGLLQTNGNLFLHPGFEPARERKLHRVILSGKENGRHWITLDGPGTSAWRTLVSGSFSGARIRAYRFVDGAGKPLPYKEVGWAKGGKILDPSAGESCILLFDSQILPKGTPDFPEGGWLCPYELDGKPWAELSKDEKAELERRWRVYYEADVPLRMDDVVIVEKSGIVWPNPDDHHPRLCKDGKVTGVWDEIKGSYRYVEHRQAPPPAMDGGRSAMEMTPADGSAEIWFKLFGAKGRGDAGWYGTLDEGTRYRYEAWFKETGATGGEITLGMGDKKPGSLDKGYFGNTVTNKSFAAPAEWQRIGFTFTAPPTPQDGGIEGAIVRYKGKGKLLMDNIKLQAVYDDGDEEKPFVIYRPLFKTLMDAQPAVGRKGCARHWFGLNNASMDSLLSWHNKEGDVSTGRGKIVMGSSKALTLPRVLTICEATGDSPGTRMVPMITAQVTHDENEYRQLIEYLAASYDPDRDKPADKPMAFKRFRQRGHGRPWTEDFREIIIEFGNENWHNRANPNWIGLGRMGHIWGGGVEYGLWAKYMIEEMKTSPYFNGDVLHFNMGGAYSTQVKDGETTGFQPESIRAAGGLVQYSGPATYIGPRWETGESSETSIDDDGVRKTLVSYRMFKEDEWTRQEESMKILQSQGHPTRLLAYEGGPSGFGLRAKSKEQERAGEYYGKSYAMGTAILDAWIDAWKKGFTHQCYLNFGQGKWWNSHTSMSRGHRPSPGWLAQTLINRHLANHHILKTTVVDSPTSKFEIPQRGKNKKASQYREIQVVRAHAFGDDTYLAVVLVNLDLDNSHPVTVKLPMTNAARITRHSIKGDPRDTNLDTLNVTLARDTIAAGQLADGLFRAELPPGAAAVFVFEP